MQDEIHRIMAKQDNRGSVSALHSLGSWVFLTAMFWFAHFIAECFFMKTHLQVFGLFILLEKVTCFQFLLFLCIISN